MDQPNVLLIEDNQADARLIEEMLKESDFGSFNLHSTDTLSGGISLISENNLDIILLDLSLPDSQGLETFKAVNKSSNGLPVIILTGLKDQSAALEAVELGAQDYLTKDSIDSNLLGRAIKYAITRKQADVNLNQYTKQLQTLNATTKAMSTTVDLSEVLDIIFDQLAIVLPYDSGAIFLKIKDRLIVKAQRGFSNKIINQSYYIDNELFQEIKDKKHPIIVNNPLNDPRFQNWSNLSRTKSWIGVPLIFRDRVIGYFTLDNNEPNAYSKDQFDLVMSFASHAAQSIENARLFNELALKTKRLSSLREIDHVITSSFDLGLTTRIILDQVVNSLDVDASAILMFDETTHLLNFIEGKGFNSNALKHTVLNLGKGFAGQAVLERSNIHISDVQVLTTLSFNY